MRRVLPSISAVLLAVAAATQDAPRTVLESRPAPDAFLCRTTGADQASKLVDSFYRSLIKDFFTAWGTQPDENIVATKPLDLQLGVPTYGSDVGWITRLSGRRKLQISVEGDLQPHWFLVGDVFVLSTSARLSREMLAAQSGRSPRLVLRTPADQGKLVGLGIFPGLVLQRAWEDLAEWIRLAVDFELPEERRLSGSLARVSDACAVFGEMIGLIGEVRWQVVDRQDVRSAEGTMTFRAK
jgi:hypothetical protein